METTQGSVQELDPARRKQLEEVLVRAVMFSGEAQTSRSGWGYVTARDGGNYDEALA